MNSFFIKTSNLSESINEPMSEVLYSLELSDRGHCLAFSSSTSGPSMLCEMKCYVLSKVGVA